MKYMILLVLLLCGCQTTPVSKAPQILKVGSDAPPLNATTWIKGMPEKDPFRNKVYVIEFWATWCTPCIASIPHLSQLQDKYQSSVVIIGSASYEQQSTPTNDNREQLVEDFVKKYDSEISYSIVYDDGVNVKNWMIPANQSGIPVAFIVGRDNKIKWIGHPNTPAFEEALETVVTTQTVVARR